MMITFIYKVSQQCCYKLKQTKKKKSKEQYLTILLWKISKFWGIIDLKKRENFTG